MNKENEPSKISAAMSGIAGSAKEMLGKVVGSEKTQFEGQSQSAAAKAEYAAAQQQQHSEGTKDRLEGMAKEAKGSLTGDDQTRLQGKAQQTTGSAKQEL